MSNRNYKYSAWTGRKYHEIGYLGDQMQPVFSSEVSPTLILQQTSSLGVLHAQLPYCKNASFVPSLDQLWLP